MKPAFLKRPISARAAAVALALVALAGVVTGREKPTLEVVEAKAPRLDAAAGAPDIDLAKLRRAPAAPPQGDPFAPRSFAPAPRPQAREAVAEAPSAPPLPFTYFGRLTQNGATQVYVLRGEELISVAAGRKIDAEYRVDAVSEASIAFTYLPLKVRQSLDLGEAGG